MLKCALVSFIAAGLAAGATADGVQLDGDNGVTFPPVTSAGGGLDVQATCQQACQQVAQNQEIPEAGRQTAINTCVANCKTGAPSGRQVPAACAALCPAGTCDTAQDAKKPACAACTACNENLAAASGPGPTPPGAAVPAPSGPAGPAPPAPPPVPARGGTGVPIPAPPGPAGPAPPAPAAAAGGSQSAASGSCQQACQKLVQNPAAIDACVANCQAGSPSGRQIPAACDAVCPVGTCDTALDATKPACAQCLKCVTSAGGSSAPAPPPPPPPPAQDSSNIDFIAAGGAVLDQVTAAMTTIQGTCVANLLAPANGADAAEKKCSDSFQVGVPAQIGAKCAVPAQTSGCVDGALCAACNNDACHTAIRAVTDAEIQKIASACSDFNAAFNKLIPEFQGCITKALAGISDAAMRAQLKGDFEVPAAPDQPTTPEQLRFELFKLANECSLTGLSLTPPSKAERQQQIKQAAQKVASAKLAVAKEEQKLDPKIKAAIQGKTGQDAINAAKQVAANDPTLTEAAVEGQVQQVQAKQAEVTSAEASQAAAAQTSNSAAAAEQQGSGASAVTATAAAAAVTVAGLALLW